VNQDSSTEIRGSTSNLAALRWGALAAVIAATVLGAFLYWFFLNDTATTENAYTGSNIVRVAPQVAGPILHVYVETDERVTAGDPLFDIDPTLYQAAFRNARAQFDAAADSAGTAADSLKAAADALAEKRKGLEDALAAYRAAKDAQKDGESPSQSLADTQKAWQDALKAYNDAAAAFSAEQVSTTLTGCARSWPASVSSQPARSASVSGIPHRIFSRLDAL
jgi:membrane fusion protein (multidrug efflux system)